MSDKLETVKKEHAGALAQTQKLQGQVTAINQQMQELDRKRAALTDDLNKAATRAVELQGVVKYLGGDVADAPKSPEPAKAEEAKSEAPPAAPKPEAKPEEAHEPPPAALE